MRSYADRHVRSYADNTGRTNRSLDETPSYGAGRNAYPPPRPALITQIPGHDSIAAAARALYDGSDGALRQQITKIETAAGFTIIDRSNTPLAPTAAGGEFIQEALQIRRIARG
jgi:hypothetical protein